MDKNDYIKHIRFFEAELGRKPKKWFLLAEMTKFQLIDYLTDILQEYNEAEQKAKRSK